MEYTPWHIWINGVIIQHRRCPGSADEPDDG
uniref:Uncharacterized protein n=1 Tax=Anguilla anguilla TaxID=7936 RepID=A0A0E9V3C1_ANGAN